MTNDVSRRRFFANTCKVTAGAALGAGLAATLSPHAEIEGYSKDLLEWPWPYAELDPEAVRERAYAAYYEAGCAYGAYEGLIGELRKVVGVPFTFMPTHMMNYGAGGVAGWGTLCGALNASAAVMSLVSKSYGVLSKELLGWYTQTALPTFKPAKPHLDIETSSVAGSPLCHASVSTWCNEAGYKANAPERAERCARLTADVAGHAAVLLNHFAAGTFTSTWSLSEEAAGCLGCHSVGQEPRGDVISQMDCLDCHDGH